jgi:hypothetical protein
MKLLFDTMAPLVGKVISQGKKNGQFHVPDSRESAMVLVSVVTDMAHRLDQAETPEARKRIAMGAEHALIRMLGIDKGNKFNFMY